jgi:CheY-like chemotaxis protein
MVDGGILKIEAKKNKTEVRVTVSDNGAGIDEEALKNIFDPFFTTKEVGEGTGLGLSITHGIVEEHKGRISVKSKPGKGTVFTVSFPIADDFDRVESDSPLNIRRGSGEKILIVDDEPDVLKSLENLVKSIGYEVVLASSGGQAVAQYKTIKPDVVLLDWKMPVMDGAACAQRIFEHDPAARIVIISGYQETSVDVIDPNLKNNIKEFVTKPCDLRQLSKVIESALSS